MKNRKRYLPVLAVMLILVAVFGAGTALSAERIDTERKGSLLLEYQYGETGIQDVEFGLYRAADVSEDARLTLSGSFKDYPVRIEGLDDSGWKTAAATLATYVKKDKIEPTQVVKTNDQGRIDYGTVGTGLYLVIGQNKTVGNETYQVAPFLVSLPSLTENDSWSYDILVKPKCSVSNEPSTPGGGGGTSDKGKLTVIKVWNDEGFKELRPKSIEVALLRDGEVYRTVKLNSSNYWRHTWSGLSEEYSWDVVENDVSEYYTVTYEEDGATFTVSNSVLQEIEDGDVPKGLITLPDGAVPLAKLPQTGLLQWPIPFLAAAGLLLFMLGWKDYMGKRKE